MLHNNEFPPEPTLRHLVLIYRIGYDAFLAFLRDDGWAIASHIALSTLMSLFPFLIFVTALAGFMFGTEELAWISHTIRCIGAANQRKSLCCKVSD